MLLAIDIHWFHSIDDSWRLSIDLYRERRPASELLIRARVAVEDRARQHEQGPAYPWKGTPKHSKACHRRFKTLRLNMLPAVFGGRSTRRN
ncbi:MAG: hypothetical protein ACKON8_04120, partial [Planctomycetota bacterium]